MKWYIAVILILLAALLLDSGLLAYAMYVLLGLLLLTRFLARSGSATSPPHAPSPRLAAATMAVTKRNTATCGLTAEIGDRVKVRVTVTNDGRLPVPWVLLEDVLPREALDQRFPRLKVKGKRLRIAMLSAGGSDEAGLHGRMPDARLLPDRPAGDGERRSVRSAPPLPRGRRADVPAGLPADRAAAKATT